LVVLEKTTYEPLHAENDYGRESRKRKGQESAKRFGPGSDDWGKQ